MLGDERFLLARDVHSREPAGWVAVKERVADRDVDSIGRRVGESSVATCPKSSDEEAESGDGGGKGVEVDATDGARGHRRASSRRLVEGSASTQRLNRASERPEEEVSRATGGVDDRGVGQTKCGDRGLEGAVEDELLDEDRGLEQRVGLLGVLGEVLVEVAKEAGVPGRVSEVVAQFARIRVESGQLLAELAGAVGGGLGGHQPRRGCEPRRSRRWPVAPGGD